MSPRVSPRTQNPNGYRKGLKCIFWMHLVTLMIEGRVILLILQDVLLELRFPVDVQNPVNHGGV